MSAVRLVEDRRHRVSSEGRPAAPTASGVPLEPVPARSEATNQALARIDALADDLRGPYLLSRVLTKREAVSSSGIEGMHSALDERLVVEDTEVDHFAPPTSRHIRWSGLGET
ncbi:hypothetical protein D9623_26455 (plasmid) [Azospirillum brasilense]|uniref:Fic/DOC family N-terminal domain-containing protein n=1 Tax=Azospirillum brasilense TaxID=192 RepID=A0A4D8QWY3_AZOBR|nr:Fic/DOC family N-terminal domain-containing protein [Azospirillum brasilense]MDW7557919.1 Fic/DOC family N-terminal domain-containing protein [Azospirillum brasilense]MDW7597508.1 Fic/DOC family N-terminal domain-containing protein [Azospirillum brasilense]MDW7632736.1 Fic/DOC family N-terminal domain-containing protein [Azospirillum brasilense]MDX5950244.1 Fic/DOC family N-terminal domain-containing protein [Azospirillum brasilense]NUB26813.1 hypothetical protein [Azospirillum brasilense]